MLEGFLTDYWSQIVGFVVLIAWLNRQQALHENRIANLEKKVEVLYQLWNGFQSKLVDRGLDKDK